MLEFDNAGFLIPNSNIQASLEDLNEEFVLKIPTERRQKIYDNYLNYAEQLKVLCGNIELLQWIDGSFVTKHQKPGDIDLITFLDYSLVEKLGTALDLFKYPLSETVFEVDAYIVVTYPDAHKNHFLFHSDKAYWMNFFIKTKRNRIGNRPSKGFLEIVY